MKAARRITKAAMRYPTDWLAAILISWVVPLEFFGRSSTYFTSLFFWLVPVVMLLPRLYFETDAGGRRRRAFWGTVALVVIAGAVLDFVIGKWILRFDDETPGVYIWRVPSWGKGIPIEEFFFYVLGGMAILLVYFWADEYWMKAYNVRQRRWNYELFGETFKLLRFSPLAVVTLAVLVAVGILLKWSFGGGAWPPPFYYTFIVLASIVPAVVIYRSVKDLVNWRAFSFTCLYVLLTSSIWEVTLGIARKWWWYQPPPAVIGWYIAAFGRPPDRPYPIEAMLVWLMISFDTIFAYEFLKGLTYDTRSVREALLGGASE